MPTQSTKTKMSKSDQGEALTSSVDHDSTEYPPFKIVLPAMAAIWLAFFVVALVGDQVPPNSLCSDAVRRIEQSSVQQCQPSRGNSRALET